MFINQVAGEGNRVGGREGRRKGQPQGYFPGRSTSNESREVRQLTLIATERNVRLGRFIMNAFNVLLQGAQLSGTVVAKPARIRPFTCMASHMYSVKTRV